ncbi:hypothetical protein LYSIN_01572 [Lysinibacillus sphaericus]|uniref:Uncharacterized protein n=1 Tax=Lysinibacillus sphaericus TaxID=1421 RepID=A0A2S5D136_LYSSH|nr:hypothetical protein [Lysinibacillus sphaericus]POZ56789.1 hypothetical protein LYSIN_01572 [Lysinibacillus sphaericus]
MAKPKPFFGKVIVGQVLTEKHTIDWNSEINEKLEHRDLVIKQFGELTPKVNHEKWKGSLSSIEIVNETNAKNLADSIVRGTVGSVALGGVGAIAGMMSAKNDTTFNVMITYNNNQIDLIECDIKLYTKLLQQVKENQALGITEFEDVYFSEDEHKKNNEKWEEQNKGMWMFGCGCFSLMGLFLYLLIVIFK